jgi:CHAT domain-containing protein/tetratricopeptide (TPR) repeat protein
MRLLRSRIVLLALAAVSTAAGQPPAESLPLARRLERKLSGAETLRFSFHAEKGEFLEGVVEQYGIDVAVRVVSSTGKTLLEVDGPNDNLGPEPVYWIAPEGAEYRIEVVPGRKTDPVGRVRIRFKKPRVPRPGDLSRAQASLDYQTGNAQLAKGDRASLDQALQTFRESERHFREGRALYTAAWARYKAGMVQAAQGKRREAIAELQQAAAETARLKQRSTQSFLLQKSADQYLALGEPAEAAKLYTRALALVRRPPNPRREGNLQASIAASLFQSSRYVEAEAAYQKALPLHRAAGDVQNEAVSLASLGAVYRAMSRYDAAQSAYEQALQIQRSSGSPFGRAQVLNNLGLLNLMFGSYEPAVTYYRQALDIATENRLAVLIGQIENNLGVVYRALEQPEEALRWQQQALQAARDRSQAPLEIVSLAAMGATLVKLGRPGEARTALDGSIARAQSVPDRSSEAAARSQLALLEAAQGNFAAARTQVEAAIALRRAIGDTRGEALSLCDSGRIFLDASLDSGQTADAAARFRDCLLKTRQVGDRRAEASALEGLMNAWSAQQQIEPAIFAGKQAVNRLQEIRAEVQTLGDAAQQQFAQGNQAVYRKLASLLVNAGRLAEAQQVLGLLKQEEYFELLRRDPRDAETVNGRAALRDEEQPLDAEYAKLGQDSIRLGSRRGVLLAKASRTAQEDMELVSVERGLEGANQALQMYLDRLSSAPVKPDLGLRIEQLRESQALMQNLSALPAGTAAVFTLVMPDRVNLIVMTAQAQKAYPRPIQEAELNRLILDWRATLTNPAADPHPLGKRMFDLLLPADLLRDLDAAGVRTLMWSLDGTLRYVPLAALWDGKRYLIESYNLTLFTLGSYTHIQDAPQPAWRAAGLGVSRAHDNFPPLPGVVDELRAVVRSESSSAGALPGQVNLDTAFTRDVLRGLRAQWPVVHVASHFKFQPGSGAGSYLLLGDGSHLTMSDLRASNNIFSNVDVLTLSACNTAMGEAGADGKEVESFSVLAQRQGAKSVVASLWPVADASTATLMKNFYRDRQDHPELPKIEALRKAQLGLVRGEVSNEWTHPFYWAPFVLIGNWL